MSESQQKIIASQRVRLLAYVTLLAMCAAYSTNSEQVAKSTKQANITNVGLTTPQVAVAYPFRQGRGWDGATENAGMENAGLENVEPNRTGGNRRTGKRRTKIPGVENAGLENAGTSCVRVAKRNIINTVFHKIGTTLYFCNNFFKC